MRKLVVAVLLAVAVGSVIFAGTARGEKSAQNGGTATATLQPPGAPATVNTPVLQPPPPPGSANTPTVTPTFTATATDTPTPVPLTLKVSLAHGLVSPGSTQKVTVVTLAGASVNFAVAFPNGDFRRAAKSGNPSGHYSWSYKQPGSRMIRGNRTARVSVRATTDTQSKSATNFYVLGFGVVDVAVQPRTTHHGTVSFWVHSSAFTKVSVRLSYRNGARVTLRSRTGPRGWTYIAYKVPSSEPSGSVAVRAFARGHSSATSFRVQ